MEQILQHGDYGILREQVIRKAALELALSRPTLPIKIEDIIEEAEKIYAFLSTSSENSQQHYTESDIVSFGNYMVSEERKNSFEASKDLYTGVTVEERLTQVHHADVENWKEKHAAGNS